MAKEKKKKEPVKERPRGPTDSILEIDYVMVFLFLVLGVCTRAYLVEHPNSIVFDEEHFGKFLSWYITGEYFFDIHPPIAKLVLAVVGYYAGYDGSHLFNHQGEIFPDHVPYYVLRLIPALVGGLVVPVAYMACRLFGASPTLAALGAWFILFDNVLLGECRYIVTDAFLFFFDTLCLFSTALVAQAKPGSWLYRPSVFLVGVAVGCAMSVKYTAAGIVGTVGVHQLFLACSELARYGSKRGGFRRWLFVVLERFVIIALTALVIFFGCWMLHFYYLPYGGTGNDFHSTPFKAMLIEKETGLPVAKSKTPMFSFFSRFAELSRTMHSANMGILTKHPFASYWYQWPIAATKSLLMWQEVYKGKVGMWLWLIGNPVVWIASFVFGVLASAFLIFSSLMLVLGSPREDGPEMLLLAMFQRMWLPVCSLAIGWLGNVVPFALIPRETWLYHYAPGLIVAVMLMSVSLESIGQAIRVRWPDIYLGFQLALVLLFVLVAAMFVYLSPWVYAIPLTEAEKESMFLFSSWRP
eukprot:TRINITY_DN6771_c1_g1_i1.p1 TRINITY_DN6771_c1_g1~~TRINITY_DN6771_c1_g1_i1.p1  ORF type:complete len:525 (-),score=174.02 TRINITY_DN6771_c1_g1_i1:229-1803(-)